MRVHPSLLRHTAGGSPPAANRTSVHPVVPRVLLVSFVLRRTPVGLLLQGGQKGPGQG